MQDPEIVDRDPDNMPILTEQRMWEKESFPKKETVTRKSKTS